MAGELTNKQLDDLVARASRHRDIYPDVQRVVAELKHRRSAHGGKTNEAGGKHHELTLEEKVGTEQK